MIFLKSEEDTCIDELHLNDQSSGNGQLSSLFWVESMGILDNRSQVRLFERLLKKFVACE